jgi:hypothetical protein
MTTTSLNKGQKAGLDDPEERRSDRERRREPNFEDDGIDVADKRM